MRKAIISVLVLSLFLFVGYFTFTLLMYQRLVDEGSILADNQCLKVNPVVIERKHAYIKSMQALSDNDSDAYKNETENYLSVSKTYVAEQTNWLEMQKKYMDSWGFKYFIPSYMKEAAWHQYNSRKADAESTTLLIDAFEVAQTNTALSQELGQKSIEKVKEGHEAQMKYDGAWDNVGKLDWRTRFIKVPATKCPDENFDIPNVDDVLYPSTTPNIKL